MLILLLLTSLCLAASWWIRKNFTYWQQYRDIVPSVPGRIFSGNFLDFLQFKTNFGFQLKTIYDDEKFAKEPIVGIYGFYKPSLLINEPELIKSVLIKDFDCFCDRYAESNAHTDPIAGNMMIFIRYNLWKDVRPRLSPIFTSGKLKYMYPLIQKVGENMEKYLRSLPTVMAMEMKNLCGRYTIDVTATTLFGFCSNSLMDPTDYVYREVHKLTQFNLRRSLNNLVIFFMPKLTRVFRTRFFYKETEEFLTHTFERMLTERERTGEKRNDLFDIFVKLKQEALNNGEDVARLQGLLLSQLSMFLGAGFETSSAAMSNVLMELAKNPETLAKLRKLIHQAYVEGKGEISYETLINMEYLNMIVYETMRLYPVLPILDRKYSDPTGRAKPYSLEPYSRFQIPEGMPVYISTYSLNYDPKYWPNPNQFDPERFSTENKKLRNPLLTLAFGNGPRNCIGSRLGLLQVKTGLVHLLRNHYVRVCDQTTLQREFDVKSVILQTKSGIYLEIVRDNMCDSTEIA